MLKNKWQKMLERVLRACLTSNGALMRGMSMSLFRKKFKKGAKRVLSTYLKIQTPNFKRIQFKHPPNSYDFLNLRTPSISRFHAFYHTWPPLRRIICIYGRVCPVDFLFQRFIPFFKYFFLKKWNWEQLYQYPSLGISFKCIKEGL